MSDGNSISTIAKIASQTFWEHVIIEFPHECSLLELKILFNGEN